MTKTVRFEQVKRDVRRDFSNDRLLPQCKMHDFRYLSQGCVLQTRLFEVVYTGVHEVIQHIFQSVGNHAETSIFI